MSKNRSTLIWVAVGSAVLGSLGTLIFLDSSPSSDSRTQLSGKSEPGRPPKPQWQNSAANGAGANGAEVVTQPTDSLTAQNRRIPKYPKPTLENPPAATQVREEVALDSHATPQSLIAFAEQLTESMQAAYTNTEVRYNVSRQLMACAKDAQSRGAAQAARALCLTNLERLKDKFPEELTPGFQSLVAELPDDLLFVAGINKAKEGK
ncbi:MAG: hypothetical protein FJY29_13500 [Betaproteobacteria bacterium]|nr:hypothetical protein [Betaproteobacteria bacterium]